MYQISEATRQTQHSQIRDRQADTENHHLIGVETHEEKTPQERASGETCLALNRKLQAH